ncbi:MAG: hypothetical protein GX211_08900 [Clostridiaceae bacterium]|jgi:hypothetical protein|nr:hypothetical protein [Clostridiaceae bacterium]
MSKEQVVAGLIDGEDICKLREAVCVQVEKVYDHCREKDCIEDAVVDFVEDVQCLIDKAVKVRVKEAEVVKVLADLDDVPFKRGFFTVNVRYKIKVKVEFCYRDQINNLVSSDPKVGFVWFAKTVILFGSEGQVKVFSSTDPEFCPSADGCDGCGSMIQQDNKPTVKVEVAEPLVLNARIKRIHCPKVKPYGDEYDEIEVDDNVAAERRRILPQKNVVVTIGLFSIIKLTRLVQLLIPAFNFCVPNRECIASTDENPCDLFETIDFPFDQFFPPQAFDFPIEEEFEKERRHERREEREEREERRRK